VLNKIKAENLFAH